MHFKGIRRFIGLGLAVLAVIGATSAIVFAIVLATLSSCVHHALFEVASGSVEELRRYAVRGTTRLLRAPRHAPDGSQHSRTLLSGSAVTSRMGLSRYFP